MGSQGKIGCYFGKLGYSYATLKPLPFPKKPYSKTPHFFPLPFRRTKQARDSLNKSYISSSMATTAAAINQAASSKTLDESLWWDSFVALFEELDAAPLSLDLPDHLVETLASF